MIQPEFKEQEIQEQDSLKRKPEPVLVSLEAPSADGGPGQAIQGCPATAYLPFAEELEDFAKVKEFFKDNASKNLRSCEEIKIIAENVSENCIKFVSTNNYWNWGLGLIDKDQIPKETMEKITQIATNNKH
jgi:hypothetical protein